jgi:hypothetical protein
MKVVEKFNPVQQGHISRYHLDWLTQMPGHLMIPTHLLQWLAFRSCCNNGNIFKKRDKVIHFNKQIVDKIFGFPNGTIPFTTRSNDPDIKAEVEAIRSQYRVGNRYPVTRLESLVLGSNDEFVFIRSLILFFITTVLCPSTTNFLKSKFIYSLRDVNLHQVSQLDFATLCIDHLWEELDAWWNKFFLIGKDPNRLLWIGGCLPLLAVSGFHWSLFVVSSYCNVFVYSLFHLFALSLFLRLHIWILLILMGMFKLITGSQE